MEGREGKRTIKVLSGAGHGGVAVLLETPQYVGVLILLPFVFRASSGRFISRDGAGDRGRARQLCRRCAQGIMSDLGLRVRQENYS